MRAKRFRRQSEFDASVESLWDFHTSDEALDLLAPPLSGFRVIDRGDGVKNGSVATFTVGSGLSRVRWTALHFDVAEGRGFADVALESPFPYWLHEHRFDPLPGKKSRLTDTVFFLPPRWLPEALARLAISFLFGWRHRATRRWLRRHVDTTPDHMVGHATRAIGGS